MNLTYTQQLERVFQRSLDGLKKEMSQYGINLEEFKDSGVDANGMFKLASPAVYHSGHMAVIHGVFMSMWYDFMEMRSHLPDPEKDRRYPNPPTGSLLDPDKWINTSCAHPHTGERLKVSLYPSEVGCFVIMVPPAATLEIHDSIVKEMEEREAEIIKASSNVVKLFGNKP